MNSIDLWTLITGVASIASLFLGAWEKFPHFKRFLSPIGYILLGFTIGRITGVSKLVTFNVSTNGNSIIIISILLFISFCFYMFIRKNEHDTAFLFLFLVFMFGIIFVPMLLTISAENEIPPNDYFKLSSTYEKNGDYDTAQHYIDKYLAKISDPKLKEELTKRKEQLRRKQVESIVVN